MCVLPDPTHSQATDVHGLGSQARYTPTQTEGSAGLALPSLAYSLKHGSLEVTLSSRPGSASMEGRLGGAMGRPALGLGRQQKPALCMRGCKACAACEACFATAAGIGEWVRPT